MRAFTAFRVCFSARFYYPVYAILFLDHGLTLEQFGLLNFIWAASIVLLEVPSGALADTLGRRNLLIAAGVLMVAEMSLLLAAPLGGSALTFWFFALNRLCSGAAEAAASGADEALAYDSLRAAGEEMTWGRVLERVQRDTSLAFFFAMMLGAAVYDPRMVNAVVRFFGGAGTVEASWLVKAPVLLTLLTALAALVTALWMKESRVAGESGAQPRRISAALAESWRGTVAAVGWISRTPMAFGIILAAMLIDSIIRQFLTLASEYWRVIHLPVASFGLIGSGMALLGLFVPAIARRMSEKASPGANLFATCALVFAGFAGLSLVLPYWGIAPAVLLYGSFQLTAFFVSRYLNEAVPSERRATVLSFRGLAANLAYGLTCLLYPALVFGIKSGLDEDSLAPGVSVKDAVFIQSLGWFPWYFLATVGLFVLVYRRRCRRLRLSAPGSDK